MSTDGDTPSAGLGATESAERGEVVGEAAESEVELVARAIWAETYPQGAKREPVPTSWLRRRPSQTCFEDARAILAALSSAGRLLPPVVQTQEQWGHLDLDSGGTATFWSREEMESFAKLSGRIVPWDPPPHKFAKAVRTISTLADDGSPYGGATLTSAWREVSES